MGESGSQSRSECSLISANNSNILIDGGIFNQQILNSRKVLEVLYPKMNTDLLHDSKIYEHLVQPTKFSETYRRRCMDTEFEEIMLWSTRDRATSPVLRREFYHDTSRQSSTQLALKVAQELSRQKLLLASIILPRSNTPYDLNQHKVISTFAYRMALNIPRTQPYIMDAIEADPSIFDLNTETQIRKLIEEPLINAALGASLTEKRWWAPIVVIDGSHDQMAQIQQLHVSLMHCTIYPAEMI